SSTASSAGCGNVGVVGTVRARDGRACAARCPGQGRRSPDPTAHRSTGNRPLSRRCCRSADGGLLEDLLTAAATDAEPVAVCLCGWCEHTRLLRTGEADAALMFAPYDPDGIDADIVALEPRVAALPADHALTSASRVLLADLGIAPEEVDGRAERDMNKHGVHDLAQLVALISLGTTTTVLPISVAARYLRQGVTYVSVEDCPPATLVIAWPERSRSRGVAALVRAAAAVAQSRGMSTAVEATR
ncbi:LysR substrate-binding domain-containing protein, partial [Streptomyces sp. NPDC127044]